MNNEESKGSDVLMFFDGELVGEVESLTSNAVSGPTTEEVYNDIPADELGNLYDETSREEHDFIEEGVEVIEADTILTQSAFTVKGVTFKDVRNSLTKRGAYRLRTLNSINKIAIHHSATVTGSAESYARYHVNTLGWPGIGYHIVIEQDGTVKYCNDLLRISYHVGNANSSTVGVSMTGDFSKNKPTAAQWNSLYKVIAALRAYLPKVTSVSSIVAHQELPGYASKKCPSLDMDAMRGQINAGTTNEVANKFSNDSKIAVDKVTPVASAKKRATSKGQIGIVTIKADSLNVRIAADFNSSVVKVNGKDKVLTKGTAWKVYSKKNGLYNVGTGEWISAGTKYVEFEEVLPYVESTHEGTVEILVDSLNVRSAANFNAPVVKVNGKDKALAKGTKWKCYGEQNGLYCVGTGEWISAGAKYTKFVAK